MTPTKMLNKWLNKPYAFYFIAVVLLWIKTYVVYREEFMLGISNNLQKFLLFANPISSTLFFLGFALFFKGKLQIWLILVIDFILSFLLYANVVYYRFFNDFITLPVLSETKNFGQIGGSAKANMHWGDIFYFLDIIILLVLILSKVIKGQSRVQRRGVFSVFVFAIMIFCANLGLAEGDRPQLLSRTFDRNYLVKYLGIDNFSIYDIITSIRSDTQRVFADSSDLADVENFTKSNYTPPDPKLFGKEKNMNVIYISMESLETFALNRTIDGKEVTPFLDNLEHNPNTFYFPNFFHQVGEGKTSDAEFMMDNDLFPLGQGAVFTQKADNTYQAQPQILVNHGYTTAALHGNYKTFWNRDEMYKALGIQKFFDADYYDMKPQNVLNYGMKDKPMIKESMKYLENLPQPFESKIIQLSNHFPFELTKNDIDFPDAGTSDKIVNQYFQTAHYMDQSLQELFDYMKKDGLSKNTMLVMYGDHYGISTNHNAGMQQILGQKITPYENAQLQRVPLFIYAPGMKGHIDKTYGGEIDVRPTVLNLLGIDQKNYISFGSDLLSPQHRQIVPFRNGDVVTPKYSSVSGKCYANPTGQLVSKTLCKSYVNFGQQALNLSDKVVYGDLLRFHNVPGFTQPDRTKIDYTTDQTAGMNIPKSEQTLSIGHKVKTSGAN